MTKTAQMKSDVDEAIMNGFWISKSSGGKWFVGWGTGGNQKRCSSYMTKREARAEMIRWSKARLPCDAQGPALATI